MLVKNKIAMIGALGLASFAFADNPISNYHYLADPAATADNDMFYIITDSDDLAGDDGYTIKSLYAFSSRDMKNWTDYGIILQAKREYDNISDIWASGIDIGPDGKFYIVYPDGGGGGVGLVASKNINGPYENPIPNNKKLVNGWGQGLADCDGVAWCFDPAIFFDDDGTGYFTFGGGNNDKRPAKDNDNNIFDIYKFNSDMKGFDLNSKVQLKIGGPRAMEASYIHKKGSTYYLTYSTADLRIAYGTSNKVTGPYTYKGIFMDNPNINGKNINANNNNHHGIAEFKGKWYVVYHDRRLVQAAEHPTSLGKANPAPAYHRSVSIDEFTYNGDAMNKLTYTNEGPKQIANFDPYMAYPAITSSLQKNIRSRTDWTKGQPVKHVLTPLASKESWIRVSGVDFGAGATTFIVTAASVASGNKIEIHSGSANGTLAGFCELPQTSGWNAYEKTECNVDGLKDVVDQLFLVFKGISDSTMGILEWEFSGKQSEPQTPYGGVAVELPAKIEAENFDEGGARKGYSDSDSENKGDAEFRTSEGVDIVLGGSGKAIGYTEKGEWLEYTVNVNKAGDYNLSVNVASGSETSSLQFLVDGKELSKVIEVPKTGEDWSVYQIIDAGKVSLSEGSHEIRLTITSSFVNVDWFKLESVVNGEVVKIPEQSSADTSSMALHGTNMHMGVVKSATFDVYDLRGNKVASFNANSENEAVKIWREGLIAGMNKARGVNIIRNRANGMTVKVRSIR